MSSQTTLTEDAPMILDGTCSSSKVWPAHASIRMDVRLEVGPELVADACFLPFRDSCLDEIYLDPPHLIRKSVNLESIRASRKRNGWRFGYLDQFTRYGWWKTRDEWYRFVQLSSKEASRVLKPDGVLHFKITDPGSGARRANKDDLTKLHELKEHLVGLEIVEDRERTSNSHTNGSRVHFLTMKPDFKSTERPQHRDPEPPGEAPTPGQGGGAD